jgi:broad specificity phosphatase PhoE
MSEIRDVAEEVADRLRRRGIPLSGDEKPEDLADLLSAVESFEAAVESRGGDLMVDDLQGSEPDDPHFVLPLRAADESVRDYTTRINEAVGHVREHPDISA